MMEPNQKQRPNEKAIPSGHIKLLLTDRCNAKCFYCHMEGQKPCSSKERMDGIFVEKLLKHVECKNLSISGGEPTIHPKFEEICKAAAESGVKPILDTNGHNTDAIKKVIRYISEIRFNLDTPDSKEYLRRKGFEMDNLFKSIALARSRIPIVLNITILPENLKEIKDRSFISFAAGIGADIHFIERFDGNPKRDVKSPTSEDVREIVKGFSWGVDLSGEIWQGLKQLCGDKKARDVKVLVFRTLCSTALDPASADDFDFGRDRPHEACQKYSKLYINPAGDIKPCFMRNDTISFYDAVMSENVQEIRKAIDESVALLGSGPCKDAEPRGFKPFMERSWEDILSAQMVMRSKWEAERELDGVVRSKLAMEIGWTEYLKSQGLGV